MKFLVFDGATRLLRLLVSDPLGLWEPLDTSIAIPCDEFPMIAEGTTLQLGEGNTVIVVSLPPAEGEAPSAPA